ncbi:aminotransferase class I/II-fold pyridoxal phosphate-dependent enzyme [Numidum massiliense]|uniref:aminotransferase class I/II-fold pyridoxal phosphate-dependent enzyme n=1 Tax=Numidum massiliense TaxID=1522315 RepID=UPI0006D5A9A5|nr:aminotransferase class I/II-fold pyridoxal phosphate-dependent enzyme [Numidum massiliense]
MTRLAQAVQAIPPSGIRKYFDLAAQMEGVISLGVGEPDFITPWHVREAAISALEDGYTSYTPNSGLPALCREISRYLSKRFAVVTDPEEEILVTVGASEGIDLAIRAITDPGDEILLVEPCYVSYEPIIRLAGGVPVKIATTQATNFKLTPQHIREKVTAKTKAIIFSYPNNPTGAIMTRKELLEIAKVVQQLDLLVISDEIYAELTYTGHPVSFASLPGMKDRTVLLSGFSKAFAMTGWRIGYAAGPRDIVQAMTKIHQYTMLCAPINAQMAALEALQHGFSDMRRMVDSYAQRRNYVTHALREIGLDSFEPEGAFYAFPDISATGLSSDQFAERLILEEKVAVVPGHVFGSSGEGHVRCSYATSIEKLREAMARMERFVARYAKQHSRTHLG